MHTSTQRAYRIECRDPLVLFEKKRVTLFRIHLALDLLKRHSPIKIASGRSLDDPNRRNCKMRSPNCALAKLHRLDVAISRRAASRFE